MIQKDWRSSKCGFGAEWKESAGGNTRQMKKSYRWWREKIHSGDNRRTEETMD
jgi:hypothetical protein